MCDFKTQLYFKNGDCMSQFSKGISVYAYDLSVIITSTRFHFQRYSDLNDKMDSSLYP